ncbi:MAG: hypothetical protein RLZZ277_98 [Actinomycetota bacterium]
MPTLLCHPNLLDFPQAHCRNGSRTKSETEIKILKLSTLAQVNDELIDVEGEWWVAGSESNKKFGVLNFDSKNRGVLKVKGHLLNDLLDHGELTIFGKCAGRNYTLFSAQMTHGNIKMSGNALVARQDFITNLIFVDVHANNQSELRFTKFKFETHLLDSWLATRDYTLSETDDAYLLTLTRQTKREFHVKENFNLAICYQSGYRMSSKNIEFHNFPHFETTHNDPISVGEFHRNVLIPLLNFMSLANSSTDFLYNLIGTCTIESDEDMPHEVKILSAFRMSSVTANPEKEFRHWIDSNSADLEQYLSNWFNLYNSREIILDEYFTSRYNKDVYLEDQFFRIAKTFESWAKTVIESKKSTTQEDLELLAHVKSILSDDQFSYLKNKLNSSDSMKDFFLNLIIKQDGVITDYLSNWSLFVKRLVETRHKYVHVVHKDDLLTYDEMYVALKLLGLVLIHELLEHIGVPIELVRTRTRTSSEYQTMLQAKLRMREDLQ